MLFFNTPSHRAEGSIMYAYQQHQHYFAQIAEGLEESGAEELRTGWAPRDIRLSYRGLYFEADQAALYRINYQSRLVTRVLAPLAAFPCHATDYLYRKAKADPLEGDHGRGPDPGGLRQPVQQQDPPLAVRRACASRTPSWTTSGRTAAGGRTCARIDPDVWINLFIENNRAVISLDTSGGSLHRRGYRREGVEAPMQETVAAAIIRWTEWDGARPLVDPMCGSGHPAGRSPDALLPHPRRLPAPPVRVRTPAGLRPPPVDVGASKPQTARSGRCRPG
ncbi:MAG: hypothetical protein MZV70_60975 [Desulfobacterales bacterium]|nr:hypothetical protein [Desulfobacterales bacterium]